MKWDEIGKNIAKEIEREILPYFGRKDKSYVVGKSPSGDETEIFDKISEDIALKYLKPLDVNIVSEELGIIDNGSEWTVVIDPIDGSSNALSNFPYYGTSVALINSDGLLECAVVCNLANKDIFIKESFKPVKKGKLFESEFTLDKITNFSKIGLFEEAYANSALVKLLDENTLKFRSLGSALNFLILFSTFSLSIRYLLF